MYIFVCGPILRRRFIYFYRYIASRQNTYIDRSFYLYPSLSPYYGMKTLLVS